MSDTFWLGASTLGPGSPASGIRQFVVGEQGRITLGPSMDAGKNPMFLARLSNDLAIVHELGTGLVSAFSLGEGAVARRQAEAPTGAADPCHVVSSPDGGTVFVANYSGGALTVHPVNGGVIGTPALTVSYAGSGPNLERQRGAHPHQVVVDEEREVLYVPDLGTDSIHVHPLSGLLKADAQYRDIRLAPGAGPRHLVIDGDFLLVANELDRTVVAVDATTGETVATSTATARPGHTDDPGPSAIRLTGAGHVLVGNRGPGTIAVLHWNRDLGELRYLDEYPCGGLHPRDLETTSDGLFVIVANQWSDQLTVLAYDPVTGQLAITDTAVTPSPACVLRFDLMGSST